MQYIKRQDLTIIELRKDDNTLSFDALAEIITEKPSDIIYCERNGKLHGIVSMGDILRASDAGADCIVVNMCFTRVLNSEYMKVKNIFQEQENIHALPVVNEDNVLIGAYSRWDDLLTILYSSLGGGACAAKQLAWPYSVCSPM